MNWFLQSKAKWCVELVASHVHELWTRSGTHCIVEMRGKACHFGATSVCGLFWACSRTARAQVRYALSTECAARIDTQWNNLFTHTLSIVSALFTHDTHSIHSKLSDIYSVDDNKALYVFLFFKWPIVISFGYWYVQQCLSHILFRTYI